MTALVEIRGLVKEFPVRGGSLTRTTGTVRAVDNVDLDVEIGEVLGLVGESGCGKTTLARMVLRLIEPTAGTILLDGRDLLAADGPKLRAMRREMQVVFQDPYSSLDPRATVGDSISEGLRAHGIPREERAERVAAVMDLVGLDPALRRRFPHEFSGGQRQRVGLARALVLEPRLLIADEPVSALDVSIRSQILNLLRDLQRRLGLTVVFVSHDLAVVEHLCDRVAVMYLGRIVEIGTRDDVFERPRHPYTKALLSAVPIADAAGRERRQRIVLTGDVPSAANPPTGCRFHPRCPWAIERCSEESPALRSFGESHLAACHLADSI